VPPQEKEVSLIVKRYNLPPLKLGHGREEGLKHATDRVSQASDKVIEHKLGVMICWSGMSLRQVDQKELQEQCKMVTYAKRFGQLDRS
jgi:hypothetical protein